MKCRRAANPLPSELVVKKAHPPTTQEMAYFVLEIVSLLLFGAYYADGPMPPTLDFMMKFFGFKQYTGIEHAKPLLLTYVPLEETGAPLQIPDWIVGVTYPVLGSLFLFLTYWMIIYFKELIYSLRSEPNSPVIKGDSEYKAKALKMMKHRCSGQKFSPQEGQSFGQMTEIHLTSPGGNLLQECFYALPVDPAKMGELRRGSKRTMAFMKRTFSVDLEILDNDDHFLLFGGPRNGVREAFKYLRRRFG